jgi:hypothetical protein
MKFIDVLSIPKLFLKTKFKALKNKLVHYKNTLSQINLQQLLQHSIHHIILARCKLWS